MVEQIAYRLHQRLLGRVDVEELTQAGYFGLAHAIEHFDPDRQVQFQTFAHPRIWGEMLDQVRDRDDVPRLMRTRQKQLGPVIDRLRQELGHEPNSGDLGEATELSSEAQLELENQTQAPSHFSLQQRVAFENGRERELVEAITDRSACEPDQHAVLVDELRKVLRGCSTTERLLLLLYYCEGRTMKQIGYELDLSESRVSQLHTALIARLRALHAPAQLKQASRRTRASNKDRKYVARRIA